MKVVPDHMTAEKKDGIYVVTYDVKKFKIHRPGIIVPRPGTINPKKVKQ